MREEIMSRMTRPEDGERGLGASHRRGVTGRASYRRPPEDRRSEGLVKALVRVESPTSKDLERSGRWSRCETRERSERPVGNCT